MGSSSMQTSMQCQQDCHVLHSYFSGNGAIDRQKLVQLFVNRSSDMLKTIRQTYTSLYAQDPVSVIYHVQRNNPLARVAYLRMAEPSERDAEMMRHSLIGRNVDLNFLIEVACTRSSPELHRIKQTYFTKYYSNLEQDIVIKVHGGFKEILLAVLRSSGCYAAKANTSMAMCDAKTLYEAIESGKTIDRKAIISLLSKRNDSQVRAILASYKELYGHEFAKSLKRSKCGQFGNELRVVIRCLQFPEKFLAKQLRMKNADDHETLIRTVVTRSGIDIKDIDKAFIAKAQSSIETIVRKEFNNDRKKNYDAVADILIGLIKCR